MNKEEFEELKNRITNYFYTVEFDRSDWYKLLDYIEQLQQELNKKNKIIEEIKNYLEDNWKQTQDIWFVKIINKIQELEKGEDND